MVEGGNLFLQIVLFHEHMLVLTCLCLPLCLCVEVMTVYVYGMQKIFQPNHFVP